MCTMETSKLLREILCNIKKNNNTFKYKYEGEKKKTEAKKIHNTTTTAKNWKQQIEQKKLSKQEQTK